MWGTIDYDVEIHYWYKAGYHYPIMTIGSYSIDGDPPTTYSQFFVGSTLDLTERSIVESAVYPNPANDEINIELTNGGIIESVSIIDMKGQLIRDEKVQFVSGKATLAINNLESGCYIIESQLTTGERSRKKFQKL